MRRRRGLLGGSFAVVLAFLPRLAMAQMGAPAGSATTSVYTLTVPPPGPSPPPGPLPPPPAVTPSTGVVARPSEQALAGSRSPPKKTYTGHILLADLASIATLALGAKVESTPLITVGVAGYFTGGPIVHAAHRRYATAGASVGLRVLTPLVSAGVWFGAASLATDCRGSDELCGSVPVFAAAVGGVVGVIVAPVLDASLLARREWFDDLPLVPMVTVNRGGGSLGVGGGF